MFEVITVNEKSFQLTLVGESQVEVWVQDSLGCWEEIAVVDDESEALHLIEIHSGERVAG